MTRGFALAATCALFLGPGMALAQQDTASIVEEWARSAHAAAGSEPFTHWNAEGEIPPDCAICHAGAGFRDFHGLDGSAAGSVDAPVATGGVIDCDTCHAPGAMEISAVAFPSGVTLTPPAANGTCYTCHQGRQSGAGVARRLAGMDADTVNPELSFLNPHYAAAAATLHGAEAGGPFQYPGKDYLGRFAHVPAADQCSDCHSPHSLEVAGAPCAACHGTEDPRAVRVSTVDHDGDGDLAEGIAAEVGTLHAALLAAIQARARDVIGVPVAYAPASYPYFFNDTDGDGVAGEAEAVRDNAFRSWTPRLLAAAYNYQFVAKDPGGFAHNPRYLMQILIDSLEDLGAPVEDLGRP